MRRSTTRGGDTGVVRGGAGGESDGGEREAAAAAKAAAKARAKAAAQRRTERRRERRRQRRRQRTAGASTGGNAGSARTAAAAASASSTRAAARPLQALRQQRPLRARAGAQRVQGVLPDSLLWLVFNLLFPKMSTYTHTKSARINSHVTAAEESALAVFFGQKN